MPSELALIPLNSTLRSERYLPTRFRDQLDRCTRPQRHWRTASDTTRTQMAKASDQARRDARRAKQDRGVAR